MEHLRFEQTERTPLIDLNPTSGEFIIEGSSIPEDCLLFYKEVFSWLEEYIRNPRPETNLILRLKFFNTSTSKCLFTIFRKLEEIQNGGNKVSFVWYYQLEDTDMYESGLDFQQMIKVPFKIERT